jgi:MoaA/NifB/PqqE/SkfB family radical SAM enzyme
METAEHSPMPENRAGKFFSQFLEKINNAPVELIQTARTKIRNNTFLYAIPGHESWMPIIKLAISEVNSFITYGNSDMPMAVGIETIAACTRKCEYCPVSKPGFPESRPNRVMKDEVYDSIIDQLAAIPRRGKKHGFNGVLHLNGYGEPTIDKKIVERTTYARSKLPDATIGFYSNGDKLTEELYLELKKAGVNEIIMTPHDGEFSDRLKSLGDKYKEDGIMKLNPPLEKFSNRGGNVSIAADKLASPTNRCIHPSFTLEITVDGTVLLCCSDALIDNPLGNISKTSFNDVWDNPNYRELRQALRHGRLDKLPEICRKCRIAN